MFIEASVLSNLDITRTYSIALFGVWLAIFSGLWLVVREAIPRKDALVGTLLLVAVFWAILPEPGEALFWFTGAVENILPVALGGAAVALLASDKWRWIAYLLAIVVPGLHELFGGLMVAVLAVGAGLVWFTDRRNFASWFICAALGLASEAIVFLAPGNDVRAAYYAAPSLTSAWKISAWQLFRYLPDWTLSGAMLAMTALVLLSRPSAPWVSKYFPGLRLIILPALTFGLIAAAIGSSTYLLSAPLAPRTIAGLCLAFVIGWLLTAIGVAQRLQPPHKLLGSFVCFALAATLMLQGNTRAGLFDLKDRVRPWHNSMKDRYAALSSGSGIVVVPPAQPAPTIYFWRDILEDPTDFRNVCLARYFSVEAVAVRGDH